MVEVCDPHATLFGYLGITAAAVFANFGAAYGTAKSGVGIACMGVMRPDLVMRSIIPVIMAGVLGIYGLILGIVIYGQSFSCVFAFRPFLVSTCISVSLPATYSWSSGYTQLAAGLTVGLSALAAGLAIGVVGEAGVRAHAQQPRLFAALILIFIFAEALGIYGLIVGILLSFLKSSTPLCLSNGAGGAPAGG